MKKHSAILLLAAFVCAPSHAEPLDKLSLEQSLRIALQNHRSVHVSQAALDMAEAQYQQAMAAFGPKLSLEGGFQRADQNRTYNFPDRVPQLFAGHGTRFSLTLFHAGCGPRIF